MSNTTPPRRLVIVGCGKSKLDHATPAGELYTGQLFRLSAEYATRADAWLICSAKFGLLDPSEIIEPYDEKQRGDERSLRRLGSLCQASFCYHFENLGVDSDGGSWIDPPRVEILAGADYARAIRDFTWLKAHPDLVSEPLAGLMIGERLQKLRRMLDTSTPLAGSDVATLRQLQLTY